MIPENFIYFSLNLTQNSIEKLKRMLFKNQTIQAIIKTNRVTGEYLHHCTLFHKNQEGLENKNFYYELLKYIKDEINSIYKIKIIGWGWNNKALALLVDKESINLPRLINHKYHITVCTFNGGRPVESNNISVWDMFKTPIEVNCILTETIIK